MCDCAVYVFQWNVVLNPFPFGTHTCTRFSHKLTTNVQWSTFYVSRERFFCGFRTEMTEPPVTMGPGKQGTSQDSTMPGYSPHSCGHHCVEYRTSPAARRICLRCVPLPSETIIPVHTIMGYRFYNDQPTVESPRSSGHYLRRIMFHFLLPGPLHCPNSTASTSSSVGIFRS